MSYPHTINLPLIQPHDMNLSGTYRCVICDMEYYHVDPGAGLYRDSTTDLCPECLQHFRDMIKREKIFKPLL